MGYKLLTQLVLIVTSLVIIFTFIKPSIAGFGEVQTNLKRYNDAIENASQLNAQLEALVRTERSFSASERAKLETYLPSSINHIQVMRDIQNIFTENGQPLISLFSDAEGRMSNNLLLEGEQAEEDTGLVYRDFNMTFVGPYESLKSTLASLESNAYPLEVVSLVFESRNATGDGLDFSAVKQMKYTLVVRTFALSRTQ